MTSVMKVCVILVFLLSAACTRVVVKPEVIAPTKGENIFLKAVLKFEGNPAYLPKTVVHSIDSDLVVSYEYKLFYDGTKLNREILAGLMPTTLLGLPTGGDDVLAVATIAIMKKDVLLKTYSGEALVTRRRSIFAGGVDKTEMRRAALIAVKENLENQMLNDAQVLSNLMAKGEL